MNHRKPPLHSVVILFLIAFATLPGNAQEAAIVDEAKEKANSIMSDPRLRNMLRPIKEDPEAALDELKQNPEDAVRNATRLFQENKGSIDTSKVEAIADKVKKEGLADKAISTISQMLPAEPAVPGAAPAVAPAAVPAVPAAVSAAVAPADVPATRPAPGISGGVPTPVAMPVEPGGIPLTGTPRAVAGAPAAPGAVIEHTPVDAIVGAVPTTPMIPDSPGLNPGDIPEPQPLTRKYGAGSGGAFPSGDKQHMEILSKESIMDNTKGVLLFTGNVFIDHPEFEITCDKLEIQMAKGVGMDGSKAGESDAAFKRAIASGGMVEIKRTSLDENGLQKTQIAIARIADYDAVTKDIVLSGGPPYIQDGDRFIKTNSEDARIIMRGNGKYEITGSGVRSQIVIPVPQKEGKKAEGAGNGGGLGNPLDGFR